MKTLSFPAALLALVCFAPLLHAQDDPKRAAAEQMLQAMHADDMMAKLMANQKENVKKMTAAMMGKNLSPEALKQAEAVESASLDLVFQQLSWDSLKPDFIQIYSEVYTEQELKDLTAFYKTPLGQTLMEKMPDLQAKTMEIMQKRMVALMPAIRAAVTDAVQKAKATEDSGTQPPPPPPPAQ